MQLEKLPVLLAILLCTGVAFGQTTFDLAVKRKSCVEQSSQQVDCSYRIGKDFWLSIAAVGRTDAGITFMKSDFNGKYYGTVGVAHGCVIVKTGSGSGSGNGTRNPFDLAFISPKNGKVYRDWQSCQAAGQ
jgi:hypothetical protein